MGEFRMPSLGADMEAGTLVEWLVEPGTRVKHGDIIAVVETQKGAIEIEVFEDGILDRLLLETGAKVPIGTPLAFIRTGEDVGAAAGVPPQVAKAPPAGPRPSPPPEREREVAKAGIPSVMAPARTTRDRVTASPAARRFASRHEIDLSVIKGTGPSGAVLLTDVEAARLQGVRLETQKPAAGPDLTQMRVAIAAAMTRSKREIPHYYLAHTAEIGAAQDWVGHVNAERPPERRLLIGSLFVKATALAARRFPEFNGFFTDEGFRPNASIHVGTAIAIRGGGLVAPAIHDAADLPLDALMAKMRDLVARVRAGRFRSSEIADSTITVSSLGDRGVDTLFGVIYPPQVAIVGFGKIVERPWVRAGSVVPRPVVIMTLAADHRVSDGHRGALFLAEIDRLLQAPETL